MKKIVAMLIFLSLLSGCVTDSQLKIAQPSNNSMWKPDQQLFEIRASRILLEAPMQAVRDKDGNPILDKYGQVVMEPIKNPDGTPVMAEFHAKDTSAKPPTTILDVVKSGLGFGVIYGLGYKALGVIGVMSQGLAKDPLVIKQDAPKTDYITTDGININRG